MRYNRGRGDFRGFKRGHQRGRFPARGRFRGKRFYHQDQRRYTPSSSHFDDPTSFRQSQDFSRSPRYDDRSPSRFSRDVDDVRDSFAEDHLRYSPLTRRFESPPRSSHSRKTSKPESDKWFRSRSQSRHVDGSTWEDPEIDDSLGASPTRSRSSKWPERKKYRSSSPDRDSFRSNRYSPGRNGSNYKTENDQFRYSKYDERWNSTERIAADSNRARDERGSRVRSPSLRDEVWEKEPQRDASIMKKIKPIDDALSSVEKKLRLLDEQEKDLEKMEEKQDCPSMSKRPDQISSNIKYDMESLRIHRDDQESRQQRFLIRASSTEINPAVTKIVTDFENALTSMDKKSRPKPKIRDYEYGDRSYSNRRDSCQSSNELTPSNHSKHRTVSRSPEYFCSGSKHMSYKDQSPDLEYDDRQDTIEENQRATADAHSFRSYYKSKSHDKYSTRLDNSSKKRSSNEPDFYSTESKSKRPKTYDSHERSLSQSHSRKSNRLPDRHDHKHDFNHSLTDESRLQSEYRDEKNRNLSESRKSNYRDYREDSEQPEESQELYGKPRSKSEMRDSRSKERKIEKRRSQSRRRSLSIEDDRRISPQEEFRGDYDGQYFGRHKSKSQIFGTRRFQSDESANSLGSRSSDKSNSDFPFQTPRVSLLVHYCDYLRSIGQPLAFCDDMMTTWKMCGIQDEESLKKLVIENSPSTPDDIRKILVSLLTRIPGGRIPASVNVTSFLDQTVHYFVAEYPVLVEATSTRVPTDIDNSNHADGNVSHMPDSSDPRLAGSIFANALNKGFLGSISRTQTTGLKLPRPVSIHGGNSMSQLDNVSSERNFENTAFHSFEVPTAKHPMNFKAAAHANLITNSLPQHAYNSFKKMFRPDPDFQRKFASLTPLYEFLNKKFSVMKSFGYDASYIEGLAKGGRELLARSGWDLQSLRQLWVFSGKDGTTNRLQGELMRLEDCFPSGLTYHFLTNITTDFLEETYP